MRIVITGATGNLGTSLLTALPTTEMSARWWASLAASPDSTSARGC